MVHSNKQNYLPKIIITGKLRLSQASHLTPSMFALLSEVNILCNTWAYCLRCKHKYEYKRERATPYK